MEKCISQKIFLLLFCAIALALLWQLPVPTPYLPASVGGHGGGGGVHRPPPTISNAKLLAIGPSSATIGWTTDRPATSKIEYWVDQITGDFLEDRTATTSHVITLTGLTASTTYTFNIVSTDEEYLTARLWNYKFTTLASSPPPPALSAATSTSSPLLQAATTTPPVVTSRAPTISPDTLSPASGPPKTLLEQTTTITQKLQFTRTLARGSQGADVKALQQVLITQGLLTSGNDTGFFGPATEAALKKYQTKLGLEAVGIAGPATRKKINATLGR